MTLKEFSKKYDVPYNIVYNASYTVPAYKTVHAYSEYPEKELMDAIVKNVSECLEKHVKMLDRYTQILNRLHLAGAECEHGHT